LKNQMYYSLSQTTEIDLTIGQF